MGARVRGAGESASGERRACGRPSRGGRGAASAVLTRGSAYGCSSASQRIIPSRTATRTVQMSSASFAVTRARTSMVVGVVSVTVRL